ncbi:hypothetical protein GLOIN_2v1510726 [Rhizophagus irregularis DAOM 181602=DAOM 197198]|nr:hypothetical protein GLOIN_2v1510726 [Rhizophagus irregularis DAOM 181602=DAOM 197198]
MKRSWGFLIARQYNYQFENFYATVIQQAYRNYKKRPESLAKKVWEIVRNDATPNDKKFLGMKNEWGYHPSGQIWYDDYCFSVKNDWIYEKRVQLWYRLGFVTLILVNKLLYQQGYIVVRGTYWPDMLKWPRNPKYYSIHKKYNYEYFIRISDCEKYRSKSVEIQNICDSSTLRTYYLLGKGFITERSGERKKSLLHILPLRPQHKLGLREDVNGEIANHLKGDSSAEIFAPLYNFLKTSSLDKITTSSVITQQWNCFKIQSENEDFDCLMKILKDMENEINDDKRKQHLKSLQNINQMRFVRNELISLKDMGFLRGKFEEEVNWKTLALNNITLLKDKIKKKDTPAHKHILTTISNIDINKISNDDPLCIGVIDLSSEKYNIPESNYESLVGEKANIRNLSKDAGVKKICNEFISKRNEVHKLRKFVLPSRDIVTHDQWIEDDHIKERIAGGITDILLQEIKLNALQRVSGGSENTLVEIIARLIDMAMYHLPVDYEVEVTRAERQSKASKNRKVQQKTGSRGDKPDLMFRAYLRQKWEEIVFFESGKWDTDEDKICHDHNKLVQLCLDGTKELVKKCTKETFYRNYIGFGINIAESVEEIEEFVHALLVLRNGVIVNLQSIVNSFQKRSRKTSDISPPPREAGRLSKKNSANF